MIDLLIVSHACFTAINRKVYQLFLSDNWKIEIVAPKSLVFSSGKKLADNPQSGDPPIHYLELLGKNPRIYFFEGLETLLEKKKPAIILLDNDPVSRLANKLGNWAVKNNSRLFCISNENLPLDIPYAIKNRGWKGIPQAIAKRIMLKRSLKRLNGVFTINADGEQIFREAGFKNVRKMPLGFDPVYFFPDQNKRDSIRKELNLNGETIAYFGRISPEKGIHILIRALKELKTISWQLMMDSFDPSSSVYHREINSLVNESGLQERIVFINPSHTAIAAYMNAADWVVVPSVTTPTWKEQYGRVAAEAMACGKLVIASDSGALPDLLNGHGMLFPESDVTALRNLIKRLLEKSIDVQPSGKISAYALNELSINKQKSVMEEAFS